MAFESWNSNYPRPSTFLNPYIVLLLFCAIVIKLLLLHNIRALIQPGQQNGRCAGLDMAKINRIDTPRYSSFTPVVMAKLTCQSVEIPCINFCHKCVFLVMFSTAFRVDRLIDCTESTAWSVLRSRGRPRESDMQLRPITPAGIFLPFIAFHFRLLRPEICWFGCWIHGDGPKMAVQRDYFTPLCFSNRMVAKLTQTLFLTLETTPEKHRRIANS